MDKTSLSRVGLMHPLLRTELANILSEIEQGGVSIRLTQTLRTIQEQNDLYAIGRTKPGKIVTNAKGGQSYHNWALALDICLLHKDGSVSWSLNEDLDKDGIADWMEVVRYLKSKGWTWGGDWKNFPDNPHFEQTFGHTWRTLKVKIQDDDYIIENGIKYPKI